MKIYAICCITVLGIFIYGGQGEPVINEVFHEIHIEESFNIENVELHA